MPWHVVGKCVHKKGSSTPIKGGCHSTHEEAVKHLQALYANVDEVAKALIEELTLLKETARVAVFKQEGEEAYNIVAVSTAHIEDRQGETFTTKAMDYDIAEAYKQQDFPEFRVFHSPALGFGQVTEMKRVGIFAVDSGHSYTDDFSISVCEKMLQNNDGKWRVSRGFKAIELTANCPVCQSGLGITRKHMYVGFRCPACAQVHLSFKGMPNVNYMKARTFDVTATDVPVVPMTSMAAFKNLSEVKSMNRDQLKQRLLDAGIEEDLVDARLKSLTDVQLKQFDDIPDAEVLKHFADGGTDDQVFYLDEGVLEAIGERVTTVVKELLDGFEINLEDLDLDVELKELDTITELKEAVEQLNERLEGIDEILARYKQLEDFAPRNGRNRLRIYKEGSKKKMPTSTDSGDEEDEEDEGDTTPNGNKVTKETRRWLRDYTEPRNQEEMIVDGEGNEYKSLTEMLTT